MYKSLTLSFTMYDIRLNEWVNMKWSISGSEIKCFINRFPDNNWIQVV